MMKSRIKAKFLVVIALMTLVLNVCGSFSSLFVQAETTSSGYQIDVSYQDGYAQLTANTKQLRQGYKLVSLTGSDGQQYDPYKFSQKISQNGTYSYTLSYMLDGISSETKTETVAVNVDKLAYSSLRKSRAMPLSSLKTDMPSPESIPNVAVYPYESYGLDDSSLAEPIGKISIPSGLFIDNIMDINKAISTLGKNNRYFQIATIKREDGKEYAITGIWKYGDTIYYSVEDSQTTSKGKGIGIAYPVSSGDTIKVYAKLTGVPRTLDITQLKKAQTDKKIFNLNIAPSSGDTNKVTVETGARVIISFNWDSKYSEPVVKYNGNLVSKGEKYDVSTRRYVGSFVMPDGDQVLNFSSDLRKDVRQVGVYDNSNLTFLRSEIGYTAVGIGDRDNVATNTSATNLSIWSKVFRNQGGLLSNASTYTSTNTSNSNNRTVSNTSKITGDLDGSSINYPVKDFTVGSTIVAKYESMRSAPTPRPISSSLSKIWPTPDGEYYYTVPYQGRIDVFSDSNQSGSKNYTTKVFPLYQSKADYDLTDKKIYDSKYNVTSTAASRGLYPVQTILSNGITVTSYPIEYNRNARYSGVYSSDFLSSNYMFGPKYTFIIVVTNAYDSVRLVLGDGANTNHIYYQASGGEGIESVTGRGDDNNSSYAPDSDPTKNKQNVSLIQPGGGVRASKLNNHSFVYYHVKPKVGYSVPKPVMTVKAETKVGDIYGSPTTYNVDTVKPSFTGGKMSEEEFSKLGDCIMTGIPYNNTGAANSGKNSKDTPFYTSDGVFHYSVFVRNNPGSIHSIRFTSSPIVFTTNYDKGSITGGNYSVDKSNYFSVSQTIPNINGKSFGGWKLFAKGEGINGSSNEIQLYSGSNQNKGLYLPGDLVSVSDLYKEIAPYLTSSSIDLKNIGLEFRAQTSDATTGVATAKGTVTEYIQSQGSVVGVSDGYSKYNNKDFQLIVGSNVQITGISDTIKDSNIEYLKNPKYSSPLFVKFDGKNSKLADVYYDKVVSVNYSLGEGTGSDYTDTNKYTTTEGNASVIDLKPAPTPPAGKTFIGWKVKSNNLESTQIYSPEKDKSVDLSKLSNELKNNIFNSGNVTLVAQYQEDVSKILSPNGELFGNTQTNFSDTDSWVYEGKSFNITAKFMYEGSLESYAKLKAAGVRNVSGIHVALYKTNPVGKNNSNRYQLWWGLNSDGSDLNSDSQYSKVDGDPILSDLDPNTKIFTVTFRIKNVNNSISYEWDNGANYRIYAWTKTNPVDGTKFGTTGYAISNMTVSEADAPTKLPWGTTTTRVLKPLTIVSSGTTTDGQAITKNKLLLSGVDKLNTQLVVSTNDGLTANELKKEIKIYLAKKDPKGTAYKLWFGPNGRKGTSDYGKFYDDGFGNSAKADSPTITPIESTKDTNTHTQQYKIVMNNIADTNDETANIKWMSGAQYILAARNNSNPDISENSNQRSSSVSLDNLKAIPSSIYNTYIVKNDGNDATSDYPNVPDAMISTPGTVQLKKNSSTGKLENKDTTQGITLRSAWIQEGESNNGHVNERLSPTDKNSYFGHGYKVILSGSDIQATPSATNLVLSQSRTSQKIVASIVGYSGQKEIQLANGILGVLGFTTSSKESFLRFGISADPPSGITSQKQFSGNIGYTFERVDGLDGEGGAS